MMRDLIHLRGDLFGFGWLFGIWLAGTLGYLAWTWQRRGLKQMLGQLPVLLIVGAAIVWVLPALAGEQGLPIRGYGAMLVLGIVSGVWISASLAQRMGVDPEVILGLAFWMFLFGIGGARLFYVVQHWHEFQAETRLETFKHLLNVTEGGLVVYGGAIGGFSAMAVYLWWHRLPALAIADMAAPAVGIGLFFGRIGCFLNGCCYGGLTDLPVGVCFPAGSPPYVHQVQTGEIGVRGIRFEGAANDPAVIAAVTPGSLAERAGVRAGKRIIIIDGKPIADVQQALAALLKSQPGQELAVNLSGELTPHTWIVPAAVERALPVHPTQLYSAMDGLVICLFCLAYYPYRRRDGEVFAWLLTIYPITRFLIEIIRDDEQGVWGTGLTISQNVSLGCLVLAIAMWVYLWYRPRGSVLPAAAAVPA